jgi:hypothetical protein
MLLWLVATLGGTLVTTAFAIAPSGFTFCGREWHHGHQLFEMLEGLNVSSCAQVKRLIGSATITGGGRWAQIPQSGRWGLHGGVGPGHYGTRIPGFRCHVKQEAENGTGRSRETVSMVGISCTRGSERLMYGWTTPG